ncbi:MAG: M28 family peptidase [Bacteroidota bacterium]
MRPLLVLAVWGMFLLQPPSLLISQPTLSKEDILLQARQEIDTLCSDYLAGRGYIGEGHQKAATYLSHRFKEIGLMPKGDFGRYQQSFNIQINLPAKVTASLGSTELEAGKNLIVNRFSGSGSINAKVVNLGYGLKVKPTVRGKIAMFRDGFPPKIANDSKKKDRYKDLSRPLQRIQAILAYKPAAIIVVKEKLTMGFSREAGSIPIIEVLASDLPTKVKHATIKVESGMQRIKTQNVLGLIKGSKVPDSVLVISAHYDHLGMLSEAIFPGANDNASGTTMLLSMAEYFSKDTHQPPYSLLFIAFGGEETGLLGSQYYVTRDPKISLSRMKFLLNLDLMGNGVDGIMAVGGKDFPAFFDQLVEANEELSAVPRVRSRKNAPNSDHFFFLKNGVPGFFIYTEGGPKHYHDIYDNPTTIELSRYVEVRGLLIQFLENLMK